MATRSNRDHNQGATETYIAKSMAAKRGITTRSRNPHDQNHDPTATKATTNKRKADDSPLKNNKTKMKRSALGNLTNATVNFVPDAQNTKNLSKKTGLSNLNNTNQPKTNTNQTGSMVGGILLPPIMLPRSTKILTRAAMKNSAIAAVHEHIALDSVKSNANKKVDPGALHAAETIVKRESLVTGAKPMTRRISNEFQSDDSMYMSALEEISENNNSDTISLSAVPNTTVVHRKLKLNEENRIQSPDLSIHVVPSNVIDFDKENWDDPFQVSHYALDIFWYLKEREEYFPISDYMGRQTSLTKWMRSLLVDWMVEVQESFELNHETLYLAVKIVDLYLSKETISKDSLQLLGAAALFLSSKYEENNPPLTEDFLYICDGAYTDIQLIRMEKLVFRTINFNLGIPLSYRFLRRYARAARIPMSTLTLARYILELSLMDYGTIQFRDSKSAAAALFIALRMNDEPGWSDTLEFYSGYKIDDFANKVPSFNAILHRKPKDPINTIRKKYSHTVFLAVAKIPLKSNAELFSEYNHLIKAVPGEKNSESIK